MTKRINFAADMPLGVLFKKKRPTIFLCNRDKVVFFNNCRGAIWKSIKSLGLEEKHNILVPSYHCNVEIESVLKAGVNIKFIMIDDDLSVNFNSLLDSIDGNTKGVLIIHYYGFPQKNIKEIAEVCKERQISLIEDCAHSLLSLHNGQHLGTFGDISVYSQRKILPIPDGGALLVNNDFHIAEDQLVEPDFLISWKRFFGLLARNYKEKIRESVVYIPFKKIVEKYVSSSGNLYSTDMHFREEMGNLKASGISKYIMNRLDVENIKSKRRFNYKYILNNIPVNEFVMPAFDSLPEGVCPLGFPVKIKYGLRDHVKNSMSSMGIETYIFGERLHGLLDIKRYKESVHLSKEILCLPVHETMKIHDLDYVVKNFKCVVEGIYNEKSS
jgi:dTDP-4-amino-4,6-dideoxygalactose transaminase